MKKRLKKLLKVAENKTIKILNAKIPVNVIICILIVIGVAYPLLHKKTTYRYIDMNEKFGDAEKCYETDTELLCEAPIKVKQFYKK